MSNVEPFTFKHVRNGAPFEANEVPKLPPVALKVILQTLRKHDLGTVVSITDPGFAAVMTEIAVEVVAIALRRLDPAVSVRVIEEDEDHDEVMRLFRHLQANNPSIFPTVPEQRAQEPVDPKSEPAVSTAPSTA